MHQATEMRAARGNLALRKLTDLGCNLTLVTLYEEMQSRMKEYKNPTLEKKKDLFFYLWSQQEVPKKKTSPWY